MEGEREISRMKREQLTSHSSVVDICSCGGEHSFLVTWKSVGMGARGCKAEGDSRKEGEE